MALARKDVTPELEDRLIIEATLRGDRKAGRFLYDRYQEQVWRVVRRLVADTDEAREICQETWLKAFSSLETFRRESRFSTWVLRIAINRVNSRSRWKKIRNHVSVEAAEEDGIAVLPDRPPTQFRSVERKTENRAVRTALLGLSSKQRQAVVLRFFEELPFSDIARAMGCRETSVRTHLKRAFKNLEEALAEQIDIEDRK